MRKQGKALIDSYHFNLDTVPVRNTARIIGKPVADNGQDHPPHRYDS